MNNVYISLNSLISSGVSAIFLAKFSLFFATCFIFTIVFSKLLKKVAGIPVIAGQIFAGIVLGPTFLNISKLKVFNDNFRFFDEVSNVYYNLHFTDLFIFLIISISGAFTVSYLLWLAGYETDIKDMKEIGATALIAGALGAVIPVLICALVAFLLAFSLGASVGMGLIFSATSVSIPVAMLISQNKMHHRFAKSTMAAAIVDDILAVILLSVFVVTLRAGIWGVCSEIESLHCGSVSESLIKIMVAFVGFFAFGLTIVPYVVKWLYRKNYVTLVVPFAFFVILFYFSFSELVGGLAGITGAYFAGVFLRRVDRDHKIENTLSPLITTIFVPLFLASIGLQLDISVLDVNQWLIVAILFVMALLSKYIAIFITTYGSNLIYEKSNKWSFWETFLFGSAMVARGEVGLVISTLLKSTGIIDQSSYVICVVVIVLTTLATPLLLSIGFNFLSEKVSDTNEFVKIELGRFKVVGTKHIFDLILQVLEEKKMKGSEILLSEGKILINLEGFEVEVLYDPATGIVIQGNKETVKKLIQLVNVEIEKDLVKLGSYNSTLQ